MKNIFFLWKDAPFYAVYIIKNLIDNSKYKIKLITKIDRKNYFQYKKILKENIINTGGKTYSSWDKLKLEIPDVLFVSGWKYKEFKSLINYSKSKKIKIVSMIDNNEKKNFRQLIGKYIFNTFFKNNFDAYWVPGESSKKLLQSYGIKKGIFKSLYSINSKLFYCKKNINKRSNNFIFVGQMIQRKNINLLVSVFKKIFVQYRHHKLFIITNNYKKNIIPTKFKKNFIIKKNLSPEAINSNFNLNKYFIFLSKDDHWPLSVMESLSAGNVLILSKKIGNYLELKKTNNIFLKDFNPNNIYKKIIEVMNFDQKKLSKISEKNLKFSKKFALNSNLLAFIDIIKYLDAK